MNLIEVKINLQKARRTQKAGGSTRAQAGWAGSLSADKGNTGTYSQRTIKDVNTALYTNLTAPSPPQKGEPAGEKKGWTFRGLC